PAVLEHPGPRPGPQEGPSMMNASTIESEQVAQGCLYFALVTQSGDEPRAWLKYGFTSKADPSERLAAHRGERPGREVKLLARIQCRLEDARNLETAIKRIVKRSYRYEHSLFASRVEWVPVYVPQAEAMAMELATSLVDQAI